MFNVVGASSIVNQMAELSGCAGVSNSRAQETRLRSAGLKPFKTNVTLSSMKTSPIEVWCPHINGNPTHDPWLFSVARNSQYVTFFGEEFCVSDSPHVLQGNFFDNKGYAKPDFESERLFCRLASRDDVHSKTPGFRRWYLAKGKHPKWMFEEADSRCLDGRSQYEFALEHIEQIWAAYSDVPKFAFLNALSAHDYHCEPQMLGVLAEAYDDSLASFLDGLLSKPSTANTVVILKSDHGLQGGLAPIDYSFQMEHRSPWLEMLVPRNMFAGDVSLNAFGTNQQRLVTGFDLYHTLRGLMATKQEGYGLRSVVPSWSYNLLTDVVPDHRSCRDAFIPKEYCTCLGDKDGAFQPQYGVCNVITDQRQFCSMSSPITEQRRRFGGNFHPKHRAFAP